MLPRVERWPAHKPVPSRDAAARHLDHQGFDPVHEVVRPGSPGKERITFSEMRWLVDGEVEVEDDTGSRTTMRPGDLARIVPGSVLEFRPKDDEAHFVRGRGSGGPY